MTARCPGWLELVGGPKSASIARSPSASRSYKRCSRTIAGSGRRSIQAKLNADEVPTWGTGKKGQYWHDSYIAKILSNPATFDVTFRGKLAGGSDATAEAPIDDYFPAIIDEETHWAAQAASKARGFGKGTPGRRKNLCQALCAAKPATATWCLSTRWFEAAATSFAVAAPMPAPAAITAPCTITRRSSTRSCLGSASAARR